MSTWSTYGLVYRIFVYSLVLTFDGKRIFSTFSTKSNRSPKTPNVDKSALRDNYHCCIAAAKLGAIEVPIECETQDESNKKNNLFPRKCLFCFKTDELEYF